MHDAQNFNTAILHDAQNFHASEMHDAQNFAELVEYDQRDKNEAVGIVMGHSAASIAAAIAWMAKLRLGILPNGKKPIW